MQKDEKEPPQTTTTTATTTTTTTATTLSTTTTSTAPTKFKQPPKTNPPPIKSSTSSPPPVKTTPLPPLPPMPPIFGIQLATNHPLLEPISTIRFLKPHEKKNAFTFAFGAELAGDSEGGEKLFGSHRFDGDLLNFPLDAWVNNQGYLGNNHDAFASDPERKDNVATIDERVTYLEQLIQLKERLKRFPPGTFKIRDLLGDWIYLKCRFMLEDEFTNLSVAAIAQEKDPFVIEKILGKRIRERSNASPNFVPPVTFNKQSVDVILVSDLPKIQAAHINADSEHFPLVTFLLMDSNEFKKIELKGLRDDQLRFVFSKSCVNKLSFQQINSVISEIKDFKLFADLNDDQRNNFDFSQIKDLKERKKAFSMIVDTNAKAFLERLNIQGIYTYIPLFEPKHYKALSQIPRHVVALNFNLWKEDARKDIFQLVYDGNSSECFEMLDLKSIYGFLPWFEYKHYVALKKVEKHALAFDFFQIPDPSQRTRTFDLFFDYGDAERLAKTDLNRIYSFLPLFKDKHYYLLAKVEKHVLAFDFTQIPNENDKRTAFINFYSDRLAKERFAKQHLNVIYGFLPWFKTDHWFALDGLEDHVVGFDYSRIETSDRERICSWWFPVNFGNDSKAAKRLSKLQPKQKDDIRPYVDKQLIKYFN